MILCAECGREVDVTRQSYVLVVRGKWFWKTTKHFHPLCWDPKE